MRDTGSRATRIQLARALWDPGPGGEMQPESQVVDRAFLAARRKEVEAALSSAEKLRALINRQLRAMHEARRKNARLDRRKR
jgi:hypothetical protein